MERPQALVLDSDPAVRAVIGDALDRRRVASLGAGRAGEATELLRTRSIDLFWLESRGRPEQGADPFGYARRLRPQPLIVGLIPAGELEREGLRLVEAGAFDVLEKPIQAARLELVVERCLRQLALGREVQELRRTLERREGYRGLVGRSPELERLRDELERLAGSDAPVSFVGEPGTGKELAGRTLHAASARAERPFVVIDDDAIAGLDARFGQALGGSVFIRQPSRLSEGSLDRLARQLESGAARVLCGWIDEPRRELGSGRMPQELGARLLAHRLQLPPLRDRAGDIVVLARHFISEICVINRLAPLRIAPETLTLLEGYAWPENVRELRNAMEQAVILAADGWIRPHDLPDRVREAEPLAVTGGPTVADREVLSFRKAKQQVVDAFEKEYLSELLRRHRGNVTAAAQQGGMLRSALQRLLRKHRLKSADFRRERRAGDDVSARSTFQGD